jgi:DNA polymerase
VFGEGPVGAKVMFVGEGPGEQEDRTGRPFVGPAGQLLDRMIEAMKLGREDCYIANVVKCRPPGNATPVPEWTVACAPYLERQIELVRPRVLVALGTPAANFLTGTALGVVRLRGRLHRRGDIPLVVTYHPAALLRDPGLKRFAWEDLKMVMARLRGV